MTTEHIPLRVDIDKIIQVLAAQIYQSPFALLRENTQNAFDAILLRMAANQEFEPKILVQIEPQRITIEDNGIGMTRQNVDAHFWRAGSSSKNNDQARAAGVVGTFGIGAMANFGIAQELIVETESALSGERTVSKAHRDTLSATENCIELNSTSSTGSPGTRVTAIMYEDNPIDVEKAIEYLKECVSFVKFPVEANGSVISQSHLEEAVGAFTPTWEATEAGVQLGSEIEANLLLRGDNSGEVWVEASNITRSGNQLPGIMILRQGVGTIRTFRSGFALAPTTVTSNYQFGGVADFLFLQPTAGREALESESLQVLQDMVVRIDERVSENLSARDQANMSTHFMNWVVKHGRYDFCGKLEIQAKPEVPGITLEKLKEITQKNPVLLYDGSDEAIISTHATEDTTLFILARSNPRRKCEANYIAQYCNVTKVDDSPKVLSVKKSRDYSIAESGFVFRITSIIEADYFLHAKIELGNLSHGLPIIVENSDGTPVIYLNPDAQSAAILISLYEKEFDVFVGMAKDFVRNLVFPQISSLVPSATKQGAEAFLKRMRWKREVFEYETADTGRLHEIWQDVLAGKLSVEEGARRSQVVVQRSYQEVDSSAAKPAREVVPDIGGSEPDAHGPGDPIPAISRTDIESDAKLMTIGDDEEALNDFRCFLAISERAREQRGEFFLQPHTTSIVWGGQRALFVFQHHSGRFGLYYDLQSPDVISATSGGGLYLTSTILLKNRIFIPIPTEIQSCFIPSPSERKRFEVRFDLLYTDETIAA